MRAYKYERLSSDPYFFPTVNVTRFWEIYCKKKLHGALIPAIVIPKQPTFEGDAGVAGRETPSNYVANSNLLPDAADPGGAAYDANNADAATEGYYDDSRHYDQGYEGYGGYGGYGEYEAGYGYDGYGYDGYYDPRYYWQDTAVAADEGSSSSPTPAAAAAAVTLPSAAPAAGGGADPSPLHIKAPSPKNGAGNEQGIGDGEAEAERKPRSVGRDGTGAGAVHLPPIGGVTAGALPPRPASR